MEMRILAVGDVVSPRGVSYLRSKLRKIKQKYDVDFCVVNGENASMTGLTPDQAEDMLDAGADVLTLGNHTWNRRQIVPYLDDCPYILRPANFAPQLPGRGFTT
ncbi:MAG: YmdB family metallophosphoesterase, partial [Eubacteriales bacterium]